MKEYFDLIKEVKPDLQFKSLKRHFSIIAKPGDKSLVSIKGLKGRQNLYTAKIFREHFLSLPLDLQESLSTLGYMDVYSEVKQFLVSGEAHSLMNTTLREIVVQFLFTRICYLKRCLRSKRSLSLIFRI